MRFEETRTMPIELKKGWDYLNDFRRWPDFYAGFDHIVEPEKGAWSKVGDSVRFTYRLLGRSIEGVLTLDGRDEGAMVKFSSKIPALPEVIQEWHYTDLDDRFILRVVLETEGATSFMGRLIEATLLPKALEKDLKRTMDNLEDIFEMGIPD
ncbi:MAG: SRPBCC family protein [Acidimicrobiia bacterium]|nr:SRPBCC family protein [Acidimicrobiia bacterium]